MRRVLIGATAVISASTLLVACTGKIKGVTGGLPPPNNPAVAANCGATPASGHTMIHRLNNVEYNNTVRDLLFTTATPANAFAGSSVGSTGFTNQSDVLTVTEQNVTDFANAAISLADGVLATVGTAGGAYETLAGCAAKTMSPSAECVKATVKAFAERAYRHPLDADDLDRLMTVYAAETDFPKGFHDVLVAVLVDPNFLFSYIKHPSPDDPKVVIALDDYALASRLSYAIWQSMPDDELRTLATQGQLKQPATLQVQVKRMLADSKAVSFAMSWRRDWAHLTLLDGTVGYGGLDKGVTDGLRQETQLFVQDLVANDRSLLTLVSGDHTFVNQSVAAFYGWTLPDVTSSTFVRVPIPDANRRGVLTQAAIMLTAGGGASYTHPVQRGRWVMDSLLCQPPPPPPPGIPPLDVSVSSDQTMRDRLNQHVASPACMGCHKVMDVYGLGLENFDTQGKWRTVYADLKNAPIDATGTVPEGGSFVNPGQMVDVLAADPQVKTCLTEKLMSYTLTRPLRGTDDACVAKVLGSQYVQQTSHLSELFAQIAQSPQFLQQQGVAP